MSINRTRSTNGKCQMPNCNANVQNTGSVVCEECYHADPHGAKTVISAVLYNANKWVPPQGWQPGKSKPATKETSAK